MRREGWKNSVFVETSCVVPGSISAYRVVEDTKRKYMSLWSPSHSDLIASDWRIAQ